MHSHFSYLAMEEVAIPIPLIDANFSKETELFMNSDTAENPTLNDMLIKKLIVISTNHNAPVLQDQSDIRVHSTEIKLTDFLVPSSGRLVSEESGRLRQ